MLANRNGNRRSGRITSRAAIDALEPRRMLATYSGTAGNDTIDITVSGGFHRVTINGVINNTADLNVTINALDGNDSINVFATRASSIFVVNGGNGDDFFEDRGRDLDGAFLGSGFLFAGGAGNDRIAADNSADDDNGRTYRIEADRLVREGPEQILLTYSDLEALDYGDTEFANTIRLANLQTASRNIQQLRVFGNGGDDIITNATSQYWGTTFGTASALIDGGAGTDTVSLYNTNATVPATYTLNGSTLGVTSSQFTTGPVAFQVCETVDIQGSAQDETFVMNSRAAGLNIRFLAVGGDDAFTVGGGDLDSNGLLTVSTLMLVDGGAGTDSMTFDDQLDAEGESEQYQLGLAPGTRLLTKGSGNFCYSNFETQVLNAADRVSSANTPNSVLISFIDSVTSTTINGGALRRCDVTVGTGNLDNIGGPVGVNLGAASGAVTIDNHNKTTAIQYRLVQTQLVSHNVVNYSGASSFTILGGIGEDTFLVDSVHSGTAVSILGNGSDDSLTLGTGNIDSDILRSVTFDGGAGADLVTVDNSQDTTLESHVLNGATFIDGQTHTFNAEELIINEGTAGTNIAVNSTIGATTVNGGNTNDTFTVGNGDLNSSLTTPLTINGFGGNDQILFNDLNDNTLDPYDFASDGVNFDRLLKQGAGGTALIISTGVESITLDASNAPTFAGDASNITVNNVAAALRIRGNAGTDRITIADASSPVLVHTGSGDADQLIVNSDAGAGDQPVVVVFEQTDDVEVLDIKQGGTVRVQPDAVLVKTRLNAIPGLLSIAGVLDLAGGAFLSTTGGPSSEFFRGLLSDGYNSGTWNGTSTTGAINSSLAAGSSPTDAIGYGRGSDIAINSIAGFNIASGDILLRYTFYGDSDLNQVVDFDDYVRTDSGFNGALTGWTNGDFDFNNTVDFDDYVLIDLGFNGQ